MKKKYCIFVIGCQMNKSDSERIASFLENLGYKKNDDIYDSDLAIITTCGVRKSAEDRIYGIVPRIKKKKPGSIVVLTGCLSEEGEVKKRLEKVVDIWMPIRELDGLGDKLDNLNQSIDDNLREASQEAASLGNYLKIQPRYESKFSAFVPIGNGCNNFCTYCYVPYARGREVYRPTEEILEEVKKLVSSGYKEITLIAQNVNSFSDKKIKFPELLKKVNDIPGDFWLRFSTSHPKDMNDALIEMMGKCEKLCHHVHLPAQAGDNEIIKKMNRHYTREHYIGLIKKIRDTLDVEQKNWQAPAAITTDIIVGFPGETKEQFNNTKKLFEEIKFDMAYIAQYSSRPKTKAADMEDDVSKDEKKRREADLMKVLRTTSKNHNNEYVGKTVEVLVEGQKKSGEYFGKTRTSKAVRIKNIDLGIKNGEIVKVKIFDVIDFGLAGELVA